mmetsp:Transcript_3381/g.5391  ORF Transcript_3381/g.5391 Transcript_3381/m.5391 type:complete len:212 (+) Transcript_3381:485-1120(+)
MPVPERAGRADRGGGPGGRDHHRAGGLLGPEPGPHGRPAGGPGGRRAPGRHGVRGHHGPRGRHHAQARRLRLQRQHLRGAAARAGDHDLDGRGRRDERGPPARARGQGAGRGQLQRGHGARLLRGQGDPPQDDGPGGEGRDPALDPQLVQPGRARHAHRPALTLRGGEAHGLRLQHRGQRGHHQRGGHGHGGCAGRGVQAVRCPARTLHQR